MQDLETWAILALASVPEACAQHDNQTEDQQQVQEQEQWQRGWATQ